MCTFFRLKGNNLMNFFMIYVGSLVFGLLIPLKITFSQGSQTFFPGSSRPNWVVNKVSKSQILSTAKNHTENSFFYPSHETQIKFSENKNSIYKRISYKIVNSELLQNYSKIQIKFDPSISKINLHSAVILRDNKEIPLDLQNDFQIIDSEAEINKNLINGTKLILGIIKDLRVNDVVLYEYSRIKDKVFQKSGFEEYLDGYYTYYNRYFSAIYSNTKDFKHRLYNFNSNNKNKVTKTTSNGITRLEYFSNKEQTIRVSENTPYSFDPYKRIEVSQYRSWKDVSGELYPYYQIGPKTQTSLDKIGNSLTKDIYGIENKISKIIDIVQNKIT